MPTSAARTSYLLLRVAAAFAFLYPPVAALFGDPYSWFGYFPAFLQGYVPDLVLLHAFGAVEIIIGLWLLSGYKIFAPALIATAMLLAIVAFNLSQFDILFRDLSIALLTLSLAVMHMPKSTSKQYE
jgi:uncharacterized membrane protein YphA (DoxX/SURF4 family)